MSRYYPDDICFYGRHAGAAAFDEEDEDFFLETDTSQAHLDVETVKFCIDSLLDTKKQISQRLKAYPVDLYGGQLHVTEELVESLEESILYLQDDLHTIETLAGI